MRDLRLQEAEMKRWGLHRPRCRSVRRGGIAVDPLTSRTVQCHAAA